MSKFPEIWFRNISDKEKAEIENTLKYNAVFKKFMDILDGYEREVQPKEVDYEKASWAYLQADRNGYLRALNKIRRLFSDQERESK